MHAAHVWVAEGIPVADALALLGDVEVFEPLGGIPIAARDAHSLSEAAHERGRLLVADDSQATFAISDPLLRGADLVLEPLEELCGERDVGLLAVGAARGVRLPALLEARLAEAPSDPGRLAEAAAAIDEFERRVRAECDAARAVAAYLSCHPKVARVSYPGLPDDPSHAAAASALHHGFGRLVDFALDDVPEDLEVALPLECGSIRRVTADGPEPMWRLSCSSPDAAAIAEALELALG
jgi:cystathionine beta-lyase/cystathionine gamma-synthase